MALREIVEILVSIAAIGNTTWIVYKSWKELRPGIKKIETETEKLDVEVDSEIVSAAHINLEGAEISTNLLMQRIRELREDLENEKKARRDDAEYFRRRFREAEREARDYRQWAARLAKQVIDAGIVPVAFIPSSDTDSDKVASVNKE